MFFVLRALQEAQEIFGIDFDYDEFRDVDENETQELEEDIDDELANEDEVAETSQLPKRTSTKSKRSKAKTIFEIYEPSELKRGHFTDLDNEVHELINFHAHISKIFSGLVLIRNCD